MAAKSPIRSSAAQGRGAAVGQAIGAGAVPAMVDRLVHHAEVIVLKGESYRLRGKREEVLTGPKER